MKFKDTWVSLLSWRFVKQFQTKHLRIIWCFDLFCIWLNYVVLEHLILIYPICISSRQKCQAIVNKTSSFPSGLVVFMKASISPTEVQHQQKVCQCIRNVELYIPAGIYSGMNGRNLVSRSTVCGVYLFKNMHHLTILSISTHVE